MAQPFFFSRFFLAAFFAVALPVSGNSPWDKPANQWNLKEAYKVLQDSPWCPSKVSLELNYTQRTTDPLTGVVVNTPVNPTDQHAVRGVEWSGGKTLPPMQVLWWSSKTVRLAKLRIRQLRAGDAGKAISLSAEPMTDYVLVIEGDEPQRILRDAIGDLHDTVFLETESGFALDLASVKFFEGSEDEDIRTEFHFAREHNGQPAIDPESEKVIFHCRATAKKQMTGRDNAISVRAEFSPKLMRAQNVPDL